MPRDTAVVASFSIAELAGLGATVPSSLSCPVLGWCTWSVIDTDSLDSSFVLVVGGDIREVYDGRYILPFATGVTFVVATVVVLVIGGQTCEVDQFHRRVHWVTFVIGRAGARSRGEIL